MIQVHLERQNKMCHVDTVKGVQEMAASSGEQHHIISQVQSIHGKSLPSS